MSKGFGESDFAQALSERANSQTIREVLEQEREQAERARDRQAQGAYGVCEDCGRFCWSWVGSDFSGGAVRSLRGVSMSGCEPSTTSARRSSSSHGATSNSFVSCDVATSRRW